MYLHALYTYPIKSCSGLTHHKLDIDLHGPRNDRRFMLVDENGLFVTQRRHPKMAHIHVDVMGAELHCWYENQSWIATIPDEDHSALKATVWKDEVNAVAFSQETNDWFSSILGFTVRLVIQADDAERLVDKDFNLGADVVRFADGFPLLLTTMASLRFINERLPYSIDMQRFRPNIVVDGVDEPFAEDNWKKLKINDVEFDLVKPCSRCVIPSIDMNSLDKQSEVTKVLKQYRKSPDGILFGQNLIHRNEGVVAVGNVIEVLE